MGKSITFWLNPLVIKCREIQLFWLYCTSSNHFDRGGLHFAGVICLSV